ncbi:MAG: 4'-phosphopantetheinyl transferase superfamily protein [Lachnospiraceae bacterium]|nr:4'-phosphopantetheinyl transferase superfamily protein [Lachnospiraceae bacterium]
MIEVYYMSVLPLEAEEFFRQAKGKIDAHRLQKVEQTKMIKDKLLRMEAGLLLQYAVKRRTEGTVTDSSAVICRQLQVDEILKTVGGPLDLSCAYGIQGKPYLEKFPEIYFSLSHSGEYALCALSDTEIGADIQQMCEEENANRHREEQIAERQFSPEEREWMKAASTPEERMHRFYRLWTAKEAYMKLTGQGLSQGMKNFAAVPGEKRILDHHAPQKEIFLHELQVPVGYASAVCVYGEN